MKKNPMFGPETSYRTPSSASGLARRRYGPKLFPSKSSPYNNALDNLISSRIVPLLEISPLSAWSVFISDISYDNGFLRNTTVIIIVQASDVATIRAIVPAQILMSNVLVSSGTTGLIHGDPHHVRCVQRPQPGESLCSTGSVSSGSLGAFVQDQHGNVYGLTAAHVVRSSDCVLSPSDADYSRLISLSETQLERLQRELEAMTKRGLPADLIAKSYRTSSAEFYRTQLSEYRSICRDLGQVVFKIMEYQQSNDQDSVFRDLALFKCQGTRITDAFAGNVFRNHIGETIRLREPQSPAPILKAGTRVQKIGRTSHCTDGEISEYRVRMKFWPGASIEGAGRSIDGQVAFASRDRNFSEDGDLGSCIYMASGSDQGIIVGLLFGGTHCDEFRQDVTYFTPWDEVKKICLDHGYNIHIPNSELDEL